MAGEAERKSAPAPADGAGAATEARAGLAWVGVDVWLAAVERRQEAQAVVRRATRRRRLVAPRGAYAR